VIRSFKAEETERLFSGRPTRRLQGIARVAQRKLRQLDAAHELRDLTIFPGNRLEALRGDRCGQHSIRVNDRFRICFVWHGSDAHDVEIVDYH
jgi:proteic killer suppression protein